MTTREHLNRQRRKSSLLHLVGTLICAGGMYASVVWDRSWAFVGLGGVALSVAGWLWLRFSGRCFYCQKRLMINGAEGAPWRVDDDLIYCPYCGTSIDKSTDEGRNARA